MLRNPPKSWIPYFPSSIPKPGFLDSSSYNCSSAHWELFI